MAYSHFCKTHLLAQVVVDRRANLLHVEVATIDGRVIATAVRRATSPLDRMRGLLGSNRLRAGDALVLEPARQVHTFGMRYPIDVVFCDARGVVVHLVRSLKPWRMTRWVGRARWALELPGGTLDDQPVRGSLVTLPSSPSRER